MKRMLRSRCYASLILLGPLATLSACDVAKRDFRRGDSGVDVQTPTIQTRYVEQQSRVQSASAPGGSWVVSLRYPRVDSGVPSEVSGPINGAIEAEAKKYACDGPGDKQFTAEITRIDAKLLSMKFEAMWMCSSMPAPASKTGGLTFDLRSGRKIELDGQLADTARGGELDRLISRETRVAMAQKLGPGTSYCPDPQRTREFFMVERAVAFVGMYPSHVDSACDVEVRIPLEELEPYLDDGSILLERGSPPGAN